MKELNLEEIGEEEIRAGMKLLKMQMTAWYGFSLSLVLGYFGLIYGLITSSLPTVEKHIFAIVATLSIMSMVRTVDNRFIKKLWDPYMEGARRLDSIKK